MSPKKLGRYELVRVLGRGAMGIVYEGRDPNLDRLVAIKTVKVESLSHEAASEYETRFRTEARSAARLQHPNIVTVYDSDRDGDVAFLVMEFIRGDDLKHHLDKGARYSLEQSVKMICDLLSALDYAHKQGIVHRDIKPANLLLEAGNQVKLTDFGVARIQDSGEATRTQGSMIGTLKYMAPEQVQGLKTDSRADLFSVAVVLYQLLTDKRPFDADNDFSIIHQIIGHNPPPPSSISPRLPAAIDAVVARALAKDREERFATAGEFASALESALRDAEDAAVLPPVDPLKKIDASGNGSKAESTPSLATAPSSVTQELELVYWKEIRDSTDPEVFEAFLARFPAGIYADLARRRLRKLGAAATSSDQTVLSGMDTQPGGSAVVQGADAARVATASLPATTASGIPDLDGQPAASPQAASDDFAQAAGETRRREASLRLGEGQFAEGAPSDVSNQVPQPTVTKRPVIVLATAGALLASLMAFMMMGKSAESLESPVVAAIPGTAVATAAVAPMVAVAPREAPVEPAGANVAANEVRSVAAKPAGVVIAMPQADVPSKAASVAKVKVAASAPVVEPARAASQQAAPVREETRVAIAPAAAPSSVDVCKDKVFLSREFCLASACEKPGSRQHSLCVAWREEKRLRDESKVSQ